jgi:8-oxo-dGTP diphosphatase
VSIPDDTQLRCSAVVSRAQAVLLLHRTRGDDWVLPGGTPRAGESMAACARREVREETGLRVDPSRVAFVLEVMGPDNGTRTVDMVFWAGEAAPADRPEILEPGLEPAFIPADQIHLLKNLRPPLAGHLRRLLSRGGESYAPYLANLWRPTEAP